MRGVFRLLSSRPIRELPPANSPPLAQSEIFLSMFLFFRIFLIRELISNPLDKAFQRRIDQERLGLMHLLHLPCVAVAVATALGAVSLPASSFAATGDGSAPKASPVMNDRGAGWREAKKTHPKKEDAKKGE